MGLDDRPSVRRPVPAVAVLLAWVLPGAGHLYVGRFGLGVVGGALVVALYAVGIVLSEGRVFELLDPEMRSTAALALTPEAGALGALLWIQSQYGFGITGPMPMPLPERIHLGALCTALGGLLNLLLLVDAHTRARLAPRAGVAPPAALVAAGWFLPGLGHFLQGRRARALAVFGLVLALFFVGTAFAEGSNLSRLRHFYYWAAQLLVGMPAIATEWFVGHPRFPRPLPNADVGLLFTALAGLFNGVLLLDVYAWQEARLAGRDPRERGAAHPAHEIPTRVSDPPAPAEPARSPWS